MGAGSVPGHESQERLSATGRHAADYMRSQGLTVCVSSGSGWCEAPKSPHPHSPESCVRFRLVSATGTDGPLIMPSSAGD